MTKRKKSSPKKDGKSDSAVSNDPQRPDEGYQVLARKYRPQTFDDLIGQDAMVRTLRNAFVSGRIAQAYMLTGVRGVGKTTTARILARALNYMNEAGEGAPTVDMPELGKHCAAIMNSRHMDVLEMDAASHTGVDNIRELIENARYRPVDARYKVYIIDEVHMLSKGAFNALLKTLEEPPPHVKFIFATTEIRKVPVTVLSRCQRFDLRRVDMDVLSDHFAQILKREGGEADEEALRLIARAAEGSVRDGLSLLDQAIALSEGHVTADHVRAMIGLADRSRIFDLLETIFKGDVANSLAQLSELHKDGAEAQQILADLSEAVHVVTRIKAAGSQFGGLGLSEAEVERADAIAGKLSMPFLTRAWQMLLKGLGEAKESHQPQAAADMVVIRLCYSLDLPAPETLVRKLMEQDTRSSEAGVPPSQPSPSQNGGPVGQHRVIEGGLSAGAAVDQDYYAEEQQNVVAENASTQVVLESFDAVIAYVGEKRDAKLKLALEEHGRLVAFQPGHIELEFRDDTPKTLANELAQKLTRWTGERWIVAFSKEKGAPSHAEKQKAAFDAEYEKVKDHPLLRDVLEQFPDAEIKAIRAAEENNDGSDDSETSQDD